MHQKLNDSKYTTWLLFKEALYKAVLIGLFIAFYISVVNSGFADKL
jgi:hypothetical protein